MRRLRHNHYQKMVKLTLSSDLHPFPFFRSLVQHGIEISLIFGGKVLHQLQVGHAPTETAIMLMMRASAKSLMEARFKSPLRGESSEHETQSDCCPAVTNSVSKIWNAPSDMHQFQTLCSPSKRTESISPSKGPTSGTSPI